MKMSARQSALVIAARCAPKPKKIGVLHLPGLGRRRGWHAWNITGFIRTLRDKNLCTAAGSYGAITVWRVGSVYHAEFHRHLRTIARSEFKSLAGVRRWMKVWFPKLEQAPIITRGAAR